MYCELGLYIDGKWLNGEGRKGEDVINPATEKPLARLPHASTADLDEALAAATKIPVIASGGIHNLGDIKSLLDAKAPGIIGAITGRAIYEGTLDVAEAQAFCDSYQG